jgi:hypothetical protein
MHPGSSVVAKDAFSVTRKPVVTVFVLQDATNVFAESGNRIANDCMDRLI